MDGNFLKNLMNKGKSFIPFFMKPPPEVHEICEGLMTFPNKKDSAKLKDINPYFSPLQIKEQEELPSVILMIIGFHHKKGSIIEYVYPESLQESFKSSKYEEFTKKACFNGIPDAVHTLEVLILLIIERLCFLCDALSESGMVWSDMFSTN